MVRPGRTDLTDGAAGIETKWVRHRVTAKNAGAIGAPKVVPTMSRAPVATTPGDTSALRAESAVMAHRAKVMKPGDTADPTARLQAMVHEPDIVHTLMGRHIRLGPGPISRIRLARLPKNQRKPKATLSPRPFDLSC